MPEPNFKNRTLWTGDNLHVMRGLNSETVDLIYLDPPFNSNKNYSAPIGSEAAGAAFKDTWTLSDVDLAWHGEIAEANPALYRVIDAARESHGKGMQSYLTMMAVRLLEMKRLLKSTGSIYLHCDPTASHYLKMVMDSVFGAGRFRSAISWKRTSGHSDAARYGSVHDDLLLYVNGEKATWNSQFQAYDDGYVKSHYRFEDSKGRRYRTGDLTAGGLAGGGYEYEWNGVTRIWRCPPERMAELERMGRIRYTSKGTAEYIRYLDEMPGVSLQDARCFAPRRVDGYPAYQLTGKGAQGLPDTEAVSPLGAHHQGQLQ